MKACHSVEKHKYRIKTLIFPSTNKFVAFKILSKNTHRREKENKKEKLSSAQGIDRSLLYKSKYQEGVPLSYHTQ